MNHPDLDQYSPVVRLLSDAYKEKTEPGLFYFIVWLFFRQELS